MHSYESMTAFGYSALGINIEHAHVLTITCCSYYFVLIKFSFCAFKLQALQQLITGTFHTPADQWRNAHPADPAREDG